MKITDEISLFIVEMIKNNFTVIKEIYSSKGASKTESVISVSEKGGVLVRTIIEKEHITKRVQSFIYSSA